MNAKTEWAPARIYLQREQGEGGSHTWCEDSVGDSDIIEEAEYVRSDVAALSAPAEAMQAGVVPAGWRMRMDADGAAVIQKDGVGGAVVTAKDEEISGAILHALVRDMLAAAPQAPVATRVEAMPTEEARRLVQRHANAARALEHMHTEKNVERLKAISAELEGILVSAQAPVADAVRAETHSTVFIMMGNTAYEGGDPVRAFATKEAADAFAQRCRDHEAAHESTPALTAPDEEWTRWETANKEWETAHPAAPFTRRDSYDTHEIQFTGSVTAPTQQPARASEAGEVHPDDAAVDAFAVALKEKLALARTKGRGGWEQCAPADLSNMLREHVEKGDPRDVANFCMFLWHLGAPITPAAQQAVTLTDDARDAARYRWLRERRFYRADNPNTSMYHKAGVDSGWLYVGTIDRDGLDAAIDAALQSHSEGEA